MCCYCESCPRESVKINCERAGKSCLPTGLHVNSAGAEYPENICCIFFYCNRFIWKQHQTGRIYLIANFQVTAARKMTIYRVAGLSLSLSCCHNTFRPCAGQHLINAASSCAASPALWLKSSVKFLFILYYYYHIT